MRIYSFSIFTSNTFFENSSNKEGDQQVSFENSSNTSVSKFDRENMKEIHTHTLKYTQSNRDFYTIYMANICNHLSWIKKI